MAYVYREYRSRGKPWCIAYRGVDGRMHREKTDAPTKELAKRLLAKKMVEVTERRVAGETIHRPNLTLNDFRKEYETHVASKKTEASADRDRRSFGIVARVFGERKLREITTGQIQKYVDERLLSKNVWGRRYRPATINRELMCLSAIFREAVKRGYVDRNPVRGLRQLPEENMIVRYLTKDERRRLVRNCPANIQPVVLCALHTGMRRGELLKLAWEDVDLDQRLLRVRITKSKRTRYIPINDELLQGFRLLARIEGCPYVFFNPETRDRWYDLNKPWFRALKDSGIEHFRFHDLRHTFASHLIQAGASLKAVQELLGHSTIEMTMRYAHLSPADLRRTVDLLNDQGNSTTHPATQTPGSNEA